MAGRPVEDLLSRDALIDGIVADPGRVVLVPGRSGAGKSTVLQQAVEVAKNERLVEPTHNVMWTDALLPVGLRSARWT